MALDPALDSEVRSLVDEYRERCLWFVRPDYYPGEIHFHAGSIRGAFPQIV
jgi:hypothetical protein